MVQNLHEWYEYPISQACELADLPRSTYHYHSPSTIVYRRPNRIWADGLQINTGNCYVNLGLGY